MWWSTAWGSVPRNYSMMTSCFLSGMPSCSIQRPQHVSSVSQRSEGLGCKCHHQSGRSLRTSCRALLQHRTLGVVNCAKWQAGSVALHFVHGPLCLDWPPQGGGGEGGGTGGGEGQGEGGRQVKGKRQTSDHVSMLTNTHQWSPTLHV